MYAGFCCLFWSSYPRKFRLFSLSQSYFSRWIDKLFKLNRRPDWRTTMKHDRYRVASLPHGWKVELFKHNFFQILWIIPVAQRSITIIRARGPSLKWSFPTQGSLLIHMKCRTLQSLVLWFPVNMSEKTGILNIQPVPQSYAVYDIPVVLRRIHRPQPFFTCDETSRV